MKTGPSPRKTGLLTAAWLVCLVLLLAAPLSATEGAPGLLSLVQEALQNNPEVKAAEARAAAARHRIPQARGLADPTVMLGYENEGTDRLSFNGAIRDMPADSRFMFSLSQTFPYPGKRALRGDAALSDAEAQEAQARSARLNTVQRVEELYNELFVSHKGLSLLREKEDLLARLEEAALTRYAGGTAPQQEAVMVQGEKYMLREKREMEEQRIRSLEAMLGAVLGRQGRISLGAPELPPAPPRGLNAEELLAAARGRNPLFEYRRRMIAAAEARLEAAKKDFYPDFTLGGTYYARGSRFPDMWNVTAAVNIPLFAETKQREGVREAEAALREAKAEAEAAWLMVEASIRENHSQLESAERLMELYKEGLIPKARQDFQLALAGYAGGRLEAQAAIGRLRALLDYETSYWQKWLERQKAAARLAALAALDDKGGRK